MTDTLLVNEIFHSIQGESTRAGEPCVFVRLTGCHLRCHYCDTEYAFHEGSKQTLDEIIKTVTGYGCNLVEVTGGEPLLQPNVHALMTQMCDLDMTVLLETSGASDIGKCDARVIRIMDLKTPGSGEVDRNDWSNIDKLTEQDEVKFVICDRRDYEWSRDTIKKYDLTKRTGAVLMGAVTEMAPGKDIAGTAGMSMRDLAEWILEDRLPVRIQSQLHKWIWDPLARGV